MPNSKVGRKYLRMHMHQSEKLHLQNFKIRMLIVRDLTN